MATKQKYYVLENGEYVVKYKDSTNVSVKNKVSPDRVSKQDNIQKYTTPKSTRNSASFHIDTQQFSSKRIFNNKKFVGVENEETDRSTYSQCITMIDKQPEQRLCHITLQLNSRIKKLEQQKEYLQQQNKHFSMKLSLNIQKHNQFKKTIHDLQNQLQQVRFNYESHMKMYNDLCVAYEGLAQQNKILLDQTRIKPNRTSSKRKSHSESQQMLSISEDQQNTFRTHEVDQAIHKTQFKIQRYIFELDLLKLQMSQKDVQINQILQQLRQSENNLSNSKLTQDFLITELQKTKAIVYNQKLLEQALNEKIARILEQLKIKETIIDRMCQTCHNNIQNNQNSYNKAVEVTKTQSDQESSIN